MSHVTNNQRAAPDMARVKRWGRLTFPLAMIANPAAAVAQDDAEEEKPRRIVLVAGGIQAGPAYPGAKATGLGPIISPRFRRAGDPLPVRSAEQSPGIPLIGGHDGLAIGPTLNFQSGRDRDDVPASFGKVGFTLEPGIFVQAFAAPWLRLRSELRHGVGGHKAFVGDVEAAFVLRPSRDRLVLTVGPRLRFAGNCYSRAFFDVSPAASAGSGLPTYAAGSGLVSANLSGTALVQITPRWGAFGFVGYERLVSDAARSPLVRDYGARGHMTGGLALTYSFRTGRRGP